MINNKTIAVAIIDTSQHILAANALINSVSNFKFDQILIYSDKHEPWCGLEVQIIEKIKTIQKYNEIVLKDLIHDLRADYVLIIQYDGFVINHNCFDDKFLTYDYIGAPWYHLCENNVGNGGFSLRSKALLEFLANIENINFEIPEDVFICQHLRSQNKLNNFNFPEIDVAAKFSFEFPVAKEKTFGFHGVFNLPLIYRNNLKYLIDNLSDYDIVKKYAFIYPIIQAISKDHAIYLQEKKSILLKEIL
jgi:hypothetical protein